MSIAAAALRATRAGSLVAGSLVPDASIIPRDGSPSSAPSVPLPTIKTNKIERRPLNPRTRLTYQFGISDINKERRIEERAALPTRRKYKLRRIIADDSEWTLLPIPKLRDLCIKYYIIHFETESETLRKMPPMILKRIVHKLPTSCSLKKTIPLICFWEFWAKMSKERWSTCDVAEYGGSWKRLYLERHITEMIELFVPGKSDIAELQEIMRLSQRHVKNLDIRQLLPPVRDKPPAERRRTKDITADTKDKDLEDKSESEESEQEEEEPSFSDHFDFQPVARELRNLEKVCLRYCVRDCGMNANFSLFRPTRQDCFHLGVCMASCKQLRVLHLYNSGLEDDHVRALCLGLMDHLTLKELDLSGNKIRSDGARCVAKVIRSQCKLTKLSLCDNHIGLLGAEAIAHALEKDSTLLSLNMRLNQTSDEGGHAIFHALLTNSTLTEIDLSANRLGLSAADMVADLLLEKDVLTSIVLSCNNIGREGARYIKAALEKNHTLKTLELWMSDCPQEDMDHIDQLLTRNREMSRVKKRKSQGVEVEKKEEAEEEEEEDEIEKPKGGTPQWIHRYLLNLWSDEDYLEPEEKDMDEPEEEVVRQTSFDELKGKYVLAHYEGRVKSVGAMEQGARIK